MSALDGPNAKLAYTVQGAAEVCSVSIDVIRGALRSGDLVAQYPSSRPVILRSELMAWLEAATAERRRKAS